MKQVVLVTGAASGLGNVIAEHFAGQGHQVILLPAHWKKLKMQKKIAAFRKISFP